jgi:CRISPR-associated protein Csh2
MKKEDAKRSEFLFCYDARMSNPNGDPDENRPRIDPISGRNLVTEFRLKRTIRDYLQKHKEGTIFIREEIDGKGTRKTIEELASPYINEVEGAEKSRKKGKTIDPKKLISAHIDIRLFGLLFAVEDIHFKQVGPVQFAIGQSLNKVQELPVRITRVVPTKIEAKAGTFGEKSILRYSFIAFHGFLNNFVATEVNLSEEDVTKMMRGLWYGTNELSTTSKYGQISRLLLRVNYKRDQSYIGDLDRYIRLEKSKDDVNLDRLDDISQIVLNVDNLLNILETNKDEIESLEYAANNDLVIKYDNKTDNARAILKEWSEKTKIRLVNLLDSLAQ